MGVPDRPSVENGLLVISPLKTDFCGILCRHDCIGRLPTNNKIVNNFVVVSDGMDEPDGREDGRKVAIIENESRWKLEAGGDIG